MSIKDLKTKVNPSVNTRTLITPASKYSNKLISVFLFFFYFVYFAEQSE